MSEQVISMPGVSWSDRNDLHRVLERLGEEILRINIENGWDVATPATWGDPKQVAVKVSLVFSEVAEALEGIRAGDRENFLEEMADVVIRTIDLTAGLGMDIGTAITQKLDRNKTRGYRHGGKTL